MTIQALRTTVLSMLNIVSSITKTALCSWRELKRLCIGLTVLASLGLGTVNAQPATLRYDAYVGMAHAGVINVVVERDEQSYLVRGDAESRGLMELIKATRGWFSANGHFKDGTLHPDKYEYYQKDSGKEKFVSVTDGQVKYIRDGRERDLTDAPIGTDLVSALWASSECSAIAQVHTGRSGYAFMLLDEAESVCHFSVQEDDEDEVPFEVDIEYGERQGLRVPIVIRSTGGWAGRLQLVE